MSITCLWFRYNIRYGKVNCTNQEVEDAANAADIHKKITTFPEGKTYSQGYWQLVGMPNIEACQILM